jgi:hypothetical protein
MLVDSCARVSVRKYIYIYIYNDIHIRMSFFKNLKPWHYVAEEKVRRQNS